MKNNDLNPHDLIHQVLASGKKLNEYTYLMNSPQYNLNLNTLVIIIGPSGAGKDTVVDLAIKKYPESLSKTITGTTRGRRYAFRQDLLDIAAKDSEINEEIQLLSNEIESLYSDERSEFIDKAIKLGWLDPDETERANAHVWMGDESRNEDDEAFYKRLEKKYELLECDVHHGNLYGLPKKSLEAAVENGAIPIFRSEISVIAKLRKSLAGIYNLLVIGIVPDNMEFMRSIIGKRVHAETRIKDSIAWIEKFPEVANYVLHNKKVESISGDSPTPIGAAEALGKVILDFAAGK